MKHIGIGVNAWTWVSPFENSALGLLAKAAEMGFDCFSIPVEQPDLIDVSAIKRTQAECGIRLNMTVAFGPDRDLTADDPKLRQNSLNYMQQCMILAEQLGTPVLVGPAYSCVGKRRKISDEQRKIEWDRAVQGLRKAGEMASQFGVKLGIEPLNRFETDLVNTCAQAKQLIQDVNSSQIKIHLDTFHMHIEEKSLFDAVVLAGDDLVGLDASECDRGTPGEGQVNWAELARALKYIGYKGDCTIETFTPDCEMIADAAAIWRSLAPSQDYLAAEGYKFLSKLLK